MPQPNKQTLFRNISSLFLVQVANYVFPLVSLPVIVRIIGPQNFGLLNYSAAIVANFVLLINYAFQLTATRRIAQAPDNLEVRNRTFSEVLFTKALLFTLSLALFSILFVVLPEMRENARVMWYSFMVCVAWVFMPDWFFQGVQQLQKVAYFNLATKALFTVAVLVVVRDSEDYVWQPLAIGIAQTIVAAAAWRYAVRRFNLRFIPVSFTRIRQVLWEGRMLFFSSVCVNLYTSANIIVLGALSNKAEVGYYTAAYRFVSVAQALISMPLYLSLFPFVGQAFGRSRNEGVETLQKLAPLVIGFAFVCGLSLWVAGPLLVRLFYGADFFPAAQMFRTMAFVPFVMCVTNLFGFQGMLNLHMDRAFLRITAGGATFSLVLNALLSWQLGGYGAASATLITEIVVATMMGIYLYRQQVRIISLQTLSPFHIYRQYRLMFVRWRKSRALSKLF